MKPNHQQPAVLVLLGVARPTSKEQTAGARQRRSSARSPRRSEWPMVFQHIFCQRSRRTFSTHTAPSNIVPVVLLVDSLGRRPSMRQERVLLVHSLGRRPSMRQRRALSNVHKTHFAKKCSKRRWRVQTPTGRIEVGLQRSARRPLRLLPARDPYPALRNSSIENRRRR